MCCGLCAICCMNINQAHSQRRIRGCPGTPPRQSKALLTQCFCYTVGLTFQSPIIEIVSTRCQILRLNCTKFHFGWGFAPDPTVGALQHSPDPLDGFKGPTCKRIEGRNGNCRSDRLPRSCFSVWSSVVQFKRSLMTLFGTPGVSWALL